MSDPRIDQLTCLCPWVGEGMLLRGGKKRIELNQKEEVDEGEEKY